MKECLANLCVTANEELTPIITEAKVLSSTSVLLSWKQPVQDSDEEPPQEYTIDVSAVGFEEQIAFECEEECHEDSIVEMAVPTGYGVEFRKVIDGLQPFTKYTFHVTSMGEESVSEASQAVPVRTAEAGET